MYFSYEKSSDSNLYPLSADEVRDIVEMNRNGEKAESLRPEPVRRAPEFVSAVGDDSISRFDNPKRKKKPQGRKGGRSRRQNSSNGNQNKATVAKNGDK